MSQNFRMQETIETKTFHIKAVCKQASTAVTKIKSMVASLPTRAMKSMKEAMATSQETSWWRQRTYRREVCVDLKDVGKCKYNVLHGTPMEQLF